MKFKSLLHLFLSILFISCLGTVTSEETKGLISKKKDIDRKITPTSLIVFAKVWDQDELVEVKNQQYPGNVKYTYNILKDEKGRIVYINEMPYSMKSDWFISYKSYFDTAGNLFAFQRQNNFLKNKCTKGAALENSIKYFDAKFEVVDSVYTLTDSYQKALKKDECVFPYNFPYKIINTLEEYKEQKGVE